jgi:tetratricopeptide (TPR) repeat protein
VMIVVLVLTLVFSDKDLGAMTTSVTVTDEAGQSVERTIPKSGFRKRLAVFNFDAAPGDTAAAWLRYGVPLALEVDLLQDIFVDVRGFSNLRQKLRQAGYAEGVDVPLSLQRKTAEELHLDHFLTGKVSHGSEGVSIEVSLYETRRGRLLQRRTFAGNDVFASIDEMSVQLKRDLGVPERHLDEVQDLPVSSLLTGSLPALRELSIGYTALLAREDWAAGARHMEAAIAADPGFAFAHTQLFQIYLSSDQARAMVPLQAAMDHAHRLPERMQYAVRTNFYYMKQEPAKMFAVAQMWADLFPQDVLAQTVLAQLAMQRNDRDAAIAAYQRALELDPGQHELLRHIGSLYDAKGDAERALVHYRRYAEQFPENAAVHLSIGDLLGRSGEPEQARASFERALVIEPSNAIARLRLAGLARNLGDFVGAVRQYDEALAAARTPEAKSQVHHSLVHYYEMRGETRRAIEQVELYLEHLARASSPFNVTMERLAHLELHVAAGREAEARQVLKSVENQFAAPFDRLRSVGTLQIELERENPDAALAALTELEAFIESLALETLRPRAVAARARVHEMRGEWQQAIAQYEEQLRLTPTDLKIHTSLGRCQRMLGRQREAEAHFQQALRIFPADPRLNYEAALLYLDTGDRARAREHLARAAQAWTAADPEFKLARETGTRLADMEGLAVHR